jgi:hypothetical protein
MEFTITNAGIQAAAVAQAGGPVINLTQFKIGSGYGYMPAVTDTALHGSLLYTGSFSNYAVNASNEVQYTCTMNESVGNFNFGEVGLYLSNGVLFALGAVSSPVTKTATTGSAAGNYIDLYAKLLLSNLAASITFPITNVALAKFLTVAGIHMLNRPIAADSNAYITGSFDDGNNIVMAYRATDYKWNFPTHQFPVVSNGSITGTSTINSAVSTNIGSLISGVVAGMYIIQFTSGVLAGFSRLLTVGASNLVSWYEVTGSAPQIGDTFDIYKSNASTIASVSTLTDEALVNAIVFGS